MHSGEYLIQRSMSALRGTGRQVSLLVSTVVMTTAALGGFHLDGDVQGQSTLTWEGYTRDAKVVRVADVRDGRLGARTQLWSGRRDGDNGTVDSFDVSPGGAAVACLRTTSRNRPWTQFVVRRPPGGTWSKPIRLPGHRFDELKCATDDTGRVTLAWGLGGPVRVMAVTADGQVQGPVRIADESVGGPQLAVSAQGAATIAFAGGERNRKIHVAQQGPGGWVSGTLSPGMLPELAMDGAGRVIVGWTHPVDQTGELGIAVGPAFTPQTVATEPRGTLFDVAAGPRGDVLVGWAPHVWAYSSGSPELRVALQRPGEPFAAPVTLAPRSALLTLALAADGTGSAAFWTGGWRNPKPVLRRLVADGSWTAAEPLPSIEMEYVAAPAGRLGAAWKTKRRDGREVLTVGVFG
jgi:hypothetical protein